MRSHKHTHSLCRSRPLDRCKFMDEQINSMLVASRGTLFLTHSKRFLRIVYCYYGSPPLSLVRPYGDTRNPTVRVCTLKNKQFAENINDPESKNKEKIRLYTRHGKRKRFAFCRSSFPSLPSPTPTATAFRGRHRRGRDKKAFSTITSCFF